MIRERLLGIIATIKNIVREAIRIRENTNNQMLKGISQLFKNYFKESQSQKANPAMHNSNIISEISIRILLSNIFNHII